MNKHYLLFGHGGSYNHGCEALTMCTANLLRSISPSCDISLSTHFAQHDEEFNLPVDKIFQRDADAADPLQMYKDAINSISEHTVCLDVAGDNYCYPNWQRYGAIHYEAKRRGAKSVLWSCSVDEDKITDEMLSCFRTRDLITVRDKNSYDTLKKKGLTNIVKVSDIAFTLQAKKTELFIENYVVINISPLIIRKTPEALKAYKALIDYIMQNTDLNIALVPHVVIYVDNDYDALSQLAVDNARVKLMSDKLCAAEYKYIVSKARFCVTARTHLSIAAYSSCVPVLAIGYNSKALGIASDLNLEEFVIDINNISSELLIDKFKALLKQENTIVNNLQRIMPSYVKSAISNKACELLK